MNGICCFDRGSACGVLIGDKKCKGCKFFKTEEQYLADRAKTEGMLRNKGLEKYQTPEKTISIRKITQ